MREGRQNIWFENLQICPDNRQSYLDPISCPSHSSHSLNLLHTPKLKPSILLDLHPDSISWILFFFFLLLHPPIQSPNSLSSTCVYGLNLLHFSTIANILIKIHCILFLSHGNSCLIFLLPHI